MSLAIGMKIKIVPQSFTVGGEDVYTPKKEARKKPAIGTVIGVYPRCFTVAFALSGGQVCESFHYDDAYSIESA